MRKISMPHTDAHTQFFCMANMIPTPTPIKTGPTQPNKPSQTPKVVATAMPPLHFRNGEKACPSTGAIATAASGQPCTSEMSCASHTGMAPLNASSSIAMIYSPRPPALATLVAPGAPSPYFLMSVCRNSLPIQTGKGRLPRKKAMIVHVSACMATRL